MWATPEELPRELRPAFRELCNTIESKRTAGNPAPGGRVNIEQSLVGGGAVQGAQQQVPEPVLERRMWETRKADKVLWRERQRIFEEVGVYVHTGKAADSHLNPENHLRGKMRYQFALLEECKKSLRDLREAENDEAGGERRNTVLRAVLRQFKESSGFLLAPARWWPDEEIGKQCGYWVMIPTGRIIPWRLEEGDNEKQKGERPTVPHVELVAIDAWGCQVHCNVCKKNGREASMVQTGCGCEGGTEPYTWRRERSTTLVPARTLEDLIQISLDQDGLVVKESFVYFGVRQNEDPSGHPRWREKRADGPGMGKVGRVVLGDAGSWRQTPRDHKLRRVAESSQAAWKGQQEAVLGELQKPKSTGAAFRVGWVGPSRYPPLIFDRSDLQAKSLVRTERWMVTERNLQVSISRHGDAGQQEAKNEWEEADRKLEPKRKAAATEVVMEASKFKWLWGRKLSDEQACIEAVVADAVDAAERGQLAEPSTWKVMRALQRLFDVKILVGENLVSWPPFFPKVVTPSSLQGGTGVGSAADRLTPFSPPPFKGCTTLKEAGPGPILLLENGLSSQELEKALSQAVGEEMVLVGSWDVMGAAVAKHNAKAKDGRRLSLFLSLKKGLAVSRKSDWWKTGDLEPCKNKSEVGIWWSEATRVRLGGGEASEVGEEVRMKLASRLQEELERGDFPELEWDHRLRTDEIWSEDFDKYLSVGPASHLRLDVKWVVAATDGGVKVVPQEAGPDIARLGCGIWYRGYDVVRGNETRVNLAFRGTGGDDSFQAEGEALLRLLRRENRDQPLAIMYDTDSVIQKVRSQTREFGAPSPNDPKLRPVVKQILDELGLRTAATAFYKMKSHADCLGNFGADQLADEGVQKEDEEADKWRPEDEGELGYMTLGPKGEAGGEYLSKRRARTAARQELARQAKLGLEAKPEGRKSLTEKWLLKKDAGRQYLRLVWGMSGSASRVLAKAITFTLPVQANLHRWFPEKHPSAKCPFCGKENETFTHFTSHCEAFHLLRTREGMTFSKGSIEALGKELKCGEDEWKVRTELTAGKMADEELFSFCLGQDDALRSLRPDGWAWSFRHKSIFVLEHSRTDDTKLESDVDLFQEPLPEELERLKTRAEDKVNKYTELVQAIKLSYPEYTVQCAAFIIGAKLSFEEERWRKNLAMFEERTPRGERRPALSEAAQERIIKRSVLAAAKATVNCWHTRLKAPRRAAAGGGR
jgi:hypothetical protein